MAILPTLFVLSFTIVSFVLTLLRKRIFWLLGSALIASQVVCLYDIFVREPAQVMWLCNVAVFLNIFLLFKFQQRVFDIFFYFTWIGCFFICLMPVNPYSLMIKDLPLIWIAYWIKHLVPLLMTVYFIRVEKRRLSNWSMYSGVVGFLVYSFVIYFYNIAFNQNILYLNKPAPFMESLGKYYFLIAVPLGYFWLACVYTVACFLGAVDRKKQSAKEEEALKINP